MTTRILRLSAFFASLALASCSSAPPPAAALHEPALSASTGAEAAATPAGAVAASEQAPGSSGRALLKEVLSWVNGVNLDEAGYQARFTSGFTSQIPYAAFVSVLASLRGEPWHSVRVEESTKLIDHLERGDQKLRVTLVPDSQDRTRIAGLLFAPDVAEAAFVAPATS